MRCELHTPPLPIRVTAEKGVYQFWVLPVAVIQQEMNDALPAVPSLTACALLGKASRQILAIYTNLVP